jgi:hypothetical protein
VLALGPRSGAATLAALAAAGVDLALGAAVAPALAVVVPLIAFLGAALTLAALVERSGIADRAASVLAARAQGSALALYALVCATLSRSRQRSRSTGRSCSWSRCCSSSRGASAHPLRRCSSGR